IPGEARARFNIRFNDCHSQVSLRTLIEKRAAAAAGNSIRWHIDWEPSNADSFVAKPGPFVDLVAGAIKDVTGREPKLSGSGGTAVTGASADLATLGGATSALPFAPAAGCCTGSAASFGRLAVGRGLWSTLGLASTRGSTRVTSGC